jgi:hypothetical protein
MPNRSSNRGKGPKDANEIAFSVVQQATGQAPNPKEATTKNPVAITLGLGRLKGNGKDRPRRSPTKPA